MPIVLRGWLRVLRERRWRYVSTQDTRENLEAVMRLIVADKMRVTGDVVSWLVLTEEDETPTRGGWLKRQRPG